MKQLIAIVAAIALTIVVAVVGVNMYIDHKMEQAQELVKEQTEKAKNIYDESLEVLAERKRLLEKQKSELQAKAKEDYLKSKEDMLDKALNAVDTADKNATDLLNYLKERRGNNDE